MSESRKDTVTGRQTTGHEWDGIEELDTPLPRWWLWVFYATIAWSIGYWVVMPAWPLVSDYTRGLMGYSQRAVVAEKIAVARAAQAPLVRKLAAMPLADIRKDPDLLDFALGGGRSAFAVNCSQCHGAGGAGARGYPNLADDSWIWGGTPEAIERTIRVGIRSAHPNTRQNMMPAFGQGALSAAQIGDAAEYVLSLGGRATDRAAALRGRAIFRSNCAACHAEDGMGQTEQGAPNLTDNIWLYGGRREDIIASISDGRGGVMPAWEGRLDDATIKQLAIYVHSLGGGQ